MATHEVRVDYSKTLGKEPATGHNRWHPGIAPIVGCDPGDEVVLQTRDAFDGQMGPEATLETVGAPDLNVVHPLTGPVFVNGAEPGDVLEVEILEVEPDRYGYTVQVPGFGFLRDVFPDPFMVRWSIADGWAESADLPGVRIPGHSFMGTIGLAPSRELMAATTVREQAALDRGGFVLPPDPTEAVPADEAIAREALRTIPPRETAGNVDIKQLGKGARLYIPVYAQGGLFSAGDAHFAQGDSETCGTAIEMRSTLHVRFAVHKGRAAARGIQDLRPRTTVEAEPVLLDAARRHVPPTELVARFHGGFGAALELLLAGRLDVAFGRSEGLGRPFPTQQLARRLVRLEPLALLLPRSIRSPAWTRCRWRRCAAPRWTSAPATSTRRSGSTLGCACWRRSGPSRPRPTCTPPGWRRPCSTCATMDGPS
jgi:formamidase